MDIKQLRYFVQIVKSGCLRHRLGTAHFLTVGNLLACTYTFAKNAVFI